MTISTPEQMREAAAQCCDNAHNPVVAICAESALNTAADAIRAIPVALHLASTSVRVCGICDIADCEAHRPTQQPVAVAVNPLVDDLVESTANHPMSLITWQSWIDDLPLPDSFNEGKAALQEYMLYLAFAAPTIQPADPLSDPRVVALVEAAKDLHRSVCGPTVFSEAVRQDSGYAYPGEGAVGA